MSSDEKVLKKGNVEVSGPGTDSVGIELFVIKLKKPDGVARLSHEIYLNRQSLEDLHSILSSR